MGSWRMTWWYEVPPTFHATASRISERSSPKSLLWATLAPLYNSFRAYAAQFSGRSRPKSAVRSYTSFHTVGGRVRAGRALKYFQCIDNWHFCNVQFIIFTYEICIVFPRENMMWDFIWDCTWDLENISFEIFSRSQLQSHMRSHIIFSGGLPLQPVWVICYRPRVSSVSCSRKVQKSTAPLCVVGVHTKSGMPQSFCRLCASISDYLLW